MRKNRMRNSKRIVVIEKLPFKERVASFIATIKAIALIVAVTLIGPAILALCEAIRDILYNIL